MSGYPTHGPGAQDGRRPVIINAYPNNGSTLPRRNQTLTRPDRQPTLRRTLMRNENRPPPAARAGATSGRTLGRPTNLMPLEEEEEEPTGCWTLSSRILTFWAIGPIRALFGVGKDKAIIQAWREKMALCIIIFFCWCLMGFFTVGLQPLLCPEQSKDALDSFREHDGNDFTEMVIYQGKGYSLTEVNSALKRYGLSEIPDDFRGSNITPLFRKCTKSGDTSTNCNKSFIQPCSKFGIKDECKLSNPKAEGKDLVLSDCINAYLMEKVDSEAKVKIKASYKWDEINGKGSSTIKYTVYNGFVLENVDKVELQTNSDTKKLLENAIGTDGTRYFLINQDMKDLGDCLIQNNSVGFVFKDSMGCGLSVIITWITTIAILGVVLTRFVMAIVFSWFVSGKLAQPKPGNKIRDLHTICLVTAYSEGEEGIRCTLNSLATTTYPDKKELLFVIADGIIVGSGNDRSTPDICVGMIVEDPKLGKAEPRSYFAIADGSKQHNMARAHAGYYIVDGHKVPAMVIVKCGTPAEAKAAKPGNRGKRDSQLLLMNFLSRVTFDDRMTPLDYDMFRKIKHICGVTPDKFEIVLMVDADTKVLPTSLSYMITAMINDPMIMGLCGETRIANKTTSWVTWIQVFEYYISHHLGKCFESLFGGVTCLPGCFCMYRIKAPKPGAPNTYVPILANPDIVEDYSENVVDTLHKKNLLLLGEDRFLTTLMLRTFPKRKMVFITQALCKTIVPDEFKVLLSQRRRWINSTVHNLMELVLVRDLCGTFCFSMQFVVGMELFGTSVLPAAIVFTVYLIVVLVDVIIKGTEANEENIVKYVWDNGPIVPLVMLFAILGLPGILVMLTTQKLIYVLWMFVYLLGLPVWNLVLPVYAFWHFDDFSWGETRKVQGDNGADHSKKEGKFDASEIPLKRWHEYEKENRKPLPLNRSMMTNMPPVPPIPNMPPGPRPTLQGSPVSRSVPSPSPSPRPPMARPNMSLGPNPRLSVQNPPMPIGPRPSIHNPNMPMGPRPLGPRPSISQPPPPGSRQSFMGPRPNMSPMGVRPNIPGPSPNRPPPLGPRPSVGPSPNRPPPLGPRPNMLPLGVRPPAPSPSPGPNRPPLGPRPTDPIPPIKAHSGK